ncbi:MAG: glycine oxidase ThiO [Planctomycetota bacterium]
MSTHHAEVIVIGGGAIGLCVAWRLGQRGIRVTLLERGACGQEASWAAAGILAPGNPNRRGPMSTLHLKSLDLYPAFVAELQEATSLDLEYTRCGRIELCATEQRYRMGLSEVRAAASRRMPDGQPVLEMFTLEQAKEREPGIGCEAFGALLCRVSARVRNTRLFKALRGACELAGVTLLEDCPVEGLVVAGEQVRGVVAKAGHFAADRVVLAAGAWSSSLHPRLEQVARVFPSKGQAVLLHMEQSPVVGIIKRQHCYLVARPDGDVYLGATDEPEAGFNKRPTTAAMSTLMAAALEMLPWLAEASVVEMWAGLRPRTEDNRPMIGPVPGLEGLIAAYGHYKTGLVFAPLTARIVCDLVLEGRSGYDLSRCLPGR